MSELADFGLIGLAVMGENLALNVESRGYRVAVFNRTTSVVDEFMSGRAQGKKFIGCHGVEKLVKSLARPRKIMLMVKAGPAVDTLIEQLIPLCDAGDIIIDGGNTHYVDTERRTQYVDGKGLQFIGTGVSGGEEGALKGPSMMPGGSPAAWPHVKPIFQAIAAKVGPNADIPCCEWVGPRGAGHYVKMVHNGIEYGDMQLICEAYFLLKHVLGLTNAELYDVFAQWNQGELDSYLIEITRDIFSVKDPETGRDMVDLILDKAGAKGTGKWMSQLALDLGVPSTLVTEAVYARCLSALKDARSRASQQLRGPADAKFSGNKQAFIEEVRQALYASKICSYAQGFVQMQAAAAEMHWPLDFGSIAMLWRGGCIIRARFLERIKEAFDTDAKLENLLLAPYFKAAIDQAQPAWRRAVGAAVQLGIPAPAFTTALTYYDGYRTASLPANLLQAQRDYFGAHTYERIDKPGSFHTDWISARKHPTELPNLDGKHSMSNPADYLHDLFGLTGQVAVVIGGTGTLGGALAEGLARAGALAVVSGRGADKGAARVEQIESVGGRADFLPVDVTQRASLQQLLENVVARHGRVDMLINGAGVNSASAYFDAKDEDWDRVIQSNLTAVHWGCQIFGRHMADQGGGAILNIASVTAHLPLSRVFAYSASKAAVVNLTQNVARELAPSGVRVNALCPGFFPAEQNRKILDATRTDNIMRQTPMARFGEPHELVGATLLMLSRAAGAFITGAAYYVDGGFTAMRF